jgi:hypothetical protein
MERCCAFSKQADFMHALRAAIGGLVLHIAGAAEPFAVSAPSE